MARRRRYRNRFPRDWPGKKKRWTAQLADTLDIATATVATSVIVATTDYASNTNLEPEGPTLVRIVGSLMVVSTVATAWSGWLMIAAYDVDSTFGAGTAGDPSVGQNAIDEEVLWWQSFRFPAETLATPLQPLLFPLDIKAKRRMQDTQVVISARATNAVAGVNGNLTMNARALLIGNAAT